MEFATRKEMREAEKKGLLSRSKRTVAESETPVEETEKDLSIQVSDASTPGPASQEAADDRGASEARIPSAELDLSTLTRRQLRELEKSGRLTSNSEPVAAAEIAQQQPISVDVESDALPQVAFVEIEPEEAAETKALIEPSEVASETQNVTFEENFEITEHDDIEPPEFRSPNIFSELPTNTFTLDSIPEAMSKEIYYDEFGEPLTTGSIKIITEGVHTSGLQESDESIELDSNAAQDAVTGYVSSVEPVSAITVIKDRRVADVLPRSSFSRSRVFTTITAVTGAAMALAGIAALIWAYQEYGPGF